MLHKKHPNWSLVAVLEADVQEDFLGTNQQHVQILREATRQPDTAGPSADVPAS